MYNNGRKPKQERANGARFEEGITPYDQVKFKTGLKFILSKPPNGRGKTLSWLASQTGGRTKAWYALAAKMQGRIVIRLDDARNVIIIAKILKDSADEEDRRLRARLNVVKKMLDLRISIDELVSMK